MPERRNVLPCSGLFIAIIQEHGQKQSDLSYEKARTHLGKKHARICPGVSDREVRKRQSEERRCAEEQNWVRKEEHRNRNST